MKRILTILMALAVMTTVAAKPQKDGEAQGKERKTEKKAKKKKSDTEVTEAGRLYVFGVALSPADSVVYMTDELLLDSAQVYKKTKFLDGRDVMSRQLANHMAAKGEKNRICSVTFAKSVKALDKLYTKQVKQFQKRGFLVKSVGQGEFRFSTIRTE